MSVNITEIFGSNVFSTDVMRERLPKGVFREVMDVMEHGGNISIETADIVANAMKDWAVEKGATHYTHWFQPLTGITAEKHDSFLTRPENSRTLLQLTGKQLIMGESDASSFPSGGLRSTHYARGYTAWDMTSPPSSREMTAGTILCIPTIFVSYHGEALDKKTPCCAPCRPLSTQALRILRLFGNTAAKGHPQVGAEQEYFLVDREKHLKRRDLIYTGRTLRARPPQGAGAGGPVLRRHPGPGGLLHGRPESGAVEAGHPRHHPAQRGWPPPSMRWPPIFTMCNLAVDQNQLTMETMKRVATRHGLVCLLHEKPYAGVNGSGKHNNWSIGTDTGENLLDPGDTPNENLQFLLVLSCIMKAVDVHADLLRQSASCVGNEHRLGGQEAPPAIISICLGDQLESVVDQIVSNADSIQLLASGKLDSGVSTVPVLSRDATDRNRTTPSPLPATSLSSAWWAPPTPSPTPMSPLNAIVAEALCDAADVLEQTSDFSSACSPADPRKYGPASADHLQRRRLLRRLGAGGRPPRSAQPGSLVDAGPRPSPQRRRSVCSPSSGSIPSLSWRPGRRSCMRPYIKVTKIEANTMIHMASKHYIPTVISYTTRLAQSITSVAAACPGPICPSSASC